ncbi:MAG TPA: DUF1127 domain-containing protein [Stellaceae bacterium]|nr:DUF1127 domain-containing protein [Stellaceae bacterium]
MTAMPLAHSGHAAAEIPRHSGSHKLGHFAARLLATVQAWRRRARDRALLAALDDRMLADIGLSRAEAEFLGNKPFWRE